MQEMEHSIGATTECLRRPVEEEGEWGIVLAIGNYYNWLWRQWLLLATLPEHCTRLGWAPSRPCRSPSALLPANVAEATNRTDCLELAAARQAVAGQEQGDAHDMVIQWQCGMIQFAWGSWEQICRVLGDAMLRCRVATCYCKRAGGTAVELLCVCYQGTHLISKHQAGRKGWCNEYG